MPVSGSQAVFLSYASEDAEAARRICESLRAAGVEVWFDQSELVGGDTWDRKIRDQISTCALFVPVISAHTQARLEGYFRLEWKLAAQRTHTMAEEKAFLLPVVIDATRDADAKVPAEFKAVQWTRLSGGETSAAFITRVQQLLGDTVAGVADPGPASPRPATTLLPTKAARRTNVVARAVGALALLATSAALFFTLRTPATSKAPNAGEGTRPPPTVVATPTASEDSISVLPFENRSSEPDSTYFADGIQDEIVTGLSLLSKLRVVGSRNSVEIFRASKKPLPQIARELGVTWIVRGSVNRTGEGVTVNVQLIRGNADLIVWANTFRSDRNSAAAIQAEVVSGLTTALKTTVSPEEKARVSRAPTDNAEAFDLYLKQREILARGSDGSPSVRRQRRDLLERAVTLDPGFVKAWADLVQLRRTSSAGRPTSQALAASKAALEILEKLDPQAPETVFARVNYLADTMEPSQALTLYERHATAFPPTVALLTQIGWLHVELGQVPEAIASMRRAVALDPVDPSARRNLIGFLFRCRRLNEALAEQRGLVALRPDLLQEGFLLGRLTYDVDGSTRQMEQFFASIPPNDREKTDVATLQSQWVQIRGDRVEALRLAQRESNSTFHTIFVGMAFVTNGNREGGRTRMASAMEAREKKGAKRTEWDASELAMMQALVGENAAALATAEELKRLMPNLFPDTQVIFRARLASIYAWAGERSRAVDELERLFREPGPHYRRFDGGDDQRARINVHELRTSLEFSPLRGDPRFEALLNDPRNNAPLF